MRTIKLPGLIVLSLSLSLVHAPAFSLLGPFAPWMDPVESYHDGTIGGPMNLGEEYRWNVPVVTYAYDQSFVQYFGSNGVAAVDSAMKILNDLPPASALAPSNYPFSTLRVNFAAQSSSLFDIKSITLSHMLEQMGLASPERFVFCLRNYSEANNTTNYNVITRNFDPITTTYSSNINNVLYDYYFFHSANSSRVDAVDFAVDPMAEAFTSVAGFNSDYPGLLFTGLTFDDVGGLKYLLNTNNLNMESLLPGVHGYGANASSYVNQALRPGVDKITFQKVRYDAVFQQIFPPFTNRFTDTFLSNGIFVQQSLERVITKPDILFTADSAGFGFVSRTGTTNWLNNGTPGQHGPGVIQPPIVVNFNRIGPTLQNNGTYPVPYTPEESTWGTFDESTNAPISYPATVGNTTAFNFRLINNSSPTPSARDSTWTLSGQPNDHFLLQTSTNLLDWSSIATITNRGGTFTYIDTIAAKTSQRYFRTIPQ
ncbi:hypothetical protein [Pedosphaera parvula]|uniref:Uncharacterized protein n=1 Tax=Pedosphaera parvula (strain Ellin514) TaxID=320771 RepID=B9XD89_PEDPL|nr:hypothetical protein [Pedosphaera parvula]EEF62035.1 hypothetical protein Cflav_PD6310 [Pedosphaera parvula Ellin514]